SVPIRCTSAAKRDRFGRPQIRRKPPFLAKDGGGRGIRTPDRGLSPYNGLANRRLQPLGHPSAQKRELCSRRMQDRVLGQGFECCQRRAWSQPCCGKPCGRAGTVPNSLCSLHIQQRKRRVGYVNNAAREGTGHPTMSGASLRAQVRIGVHIARIAFAWPSHGPTVTDTTPALKAGV